MASTHVSVVGNDQNTRPPGSGEANDHNSGRGDAASTDGGGRAIAWRMLVRVRRSSTETASSTTSAHSRQRLSRPSSPKCSSMSNASKRLPTVVRRSGRRHFSATKRDQACAAPRINSY